MQKTLNNYAGRGINKIASNRAPTDHDFTRVLPSKSIGSPSRDVAILGQKT